MEQMDRCCCWGGLRRKTVEYASSCSKKLCSSFSQSVLSICLWEAEEMRLLVKSSWIDGVLSSETSRSKPGPWSDKEHCICLIWCFFGDGPYMQCNVDDENERHDIYLFNRTEWIIGLPDLFRLCDIIFNVEIFRTSNKIQKCYPN